MNYKVNINPQEKISFGSLQKQVNGLDKHSNCNNYSGECLHIKFSKNDKWISITYYDALTGKIKVDNTFAVSPECNLIWLYYFLKNDIQYKYIDTIFPSSVFNKI